MDEYPELSSDFYVLYDRVMNPLVVQLGRKVQRDHSMRRGRPSTSSSTFDQPSSSHLNDDDDDENNEGTSRASTPSPIRYVNSLTNQVPQLDEVTSSKNYVRKFLRALHPKWRAKQKFERKSLASKAKKESSVEECFDFDSEDEECGDPNHPIGECPKPPKDKNQKAFVGGSWSDSGEEDDEKICLGVDLEPNEWSRMMDALKNMNRQLKALLLLQCHTMEFIEFECLLEINEQVCPRFILEFYSQYQLSYSDKHEMFVDFVIQNQLFSYSLENFAQILGVPCEGACVFSDRWRVDEVIYGIPTDGPYQTNLPPVEYIISSIRVDHDGQVCRIRHEEEIDVLEYQVLTHEIEPSLKPLEEIIRENVFCLGSDDVTLISVVYLKGLYA
ncbi:hypothetical protein Tco_1370619 [Tanacetum coccineum]